MKVFEIKKFILSSSLKACDLNPIFISVLTYCLDIIIAHITDIINISMETSLLLLLHSQEPFFKSYLDD